MNQDLSLSETNPHSPTRVPELLAPAGGPESLRAAVNNGADAVYLGVESLNARRSAKNFSLETLPEVCHFAHLHGVRVYLTANVLVLADEMITAVEMVSRAWETGIDAVIVQDLGLLRLLRRELPHVRIHASTQMNTHNSATVEELARLGVSRVTLARETSLGEISTLAAVEGIEVESFVHGALCVSYSGQCLMSSMIGGRSGNRGLCAQPCRMPYELTDGRREVVETPGLYLLSPRDIVGIGQLPALIEAGVSAFKIEGRMKSPEYVALVTRVYRAALDRALEDPAEFSITEGERSILDEAFSRGFSPAYLLEERGNSMMSYTRPNNRGVAIGRVSRLEDHWATVALEGALDSGDTIEFWTNNGRFAQKVGTMRYEDGTTMSAPAGASVGILAEKRLSKSDRVFRVVNASLEQAAKRTFTKDASEGTIDLDISVTLVRNRPLTVRVNDGTHFGAAEGPTIEVARTKPITADEVAEHVGRLGGTPYRAASWDIELDAGAGVGYSTLHRVRREAIDEYEASVLAPWADRSFQNIEISVPRGRKHETAAPEIVVATSDISIARACLDTNVARVQIPVWLLKEFGGKVPDRIVPVIPRIAHDTEADGFLRDVAKCQRVVVGNLGLIRKLADEGIEVEADWSLGAVNPWTLEALVDLGASSVWLSPELSGRQIAEMAQHSKVRVGTAIWGRQELMVTEHCVLMAQGPCKRNCDTCKRRHGRHTLRDQKGYEFPVVTDPTGRSHIYNAVPLDLTRALNEVVETGLGAVRLDLHVDSLRFAQRVVSEVGDILRTAVAGRTVPDAAMVENTTSGHFFRGVK
ncbi:MAG: DUF3656 domain-containing protein [Actinomycetota bacterium]|jgi:putative protease|nr:DUF3656 domain-containing protein [Actinomycetota bacterium]